MTVVLDASALLVFLQGEGGSEVIEELLSDDARCAAVNWSEVAQKVRAAGSDWPLARALLISYGLQVEASTVDDAEWAAARWRRGDGLSLADRFCLALTERLAVPVWTADAAWGTEAPVRQLR